MTRVFAMMVLMYFTLAAAKTEEECSQEAEDKVGIALKDKYGEGEDALGKLLKEHDHDGDGHVTEPDIVKVMQTIGIDPDCHKIAGKIIEHLKEMHDHDEDGKLTHEEASRFKQRDEM